MINIVVLISVLLFAAGTPGGMFSSPTDSFHLSFDPSLENLNCQEASPKYLAEQSGKEMGKAATFNLDGQYHCKRNLFAYGERDSFYDFVTRSADSHAESLVARIAKVSREYQSVGLRFKTNDPDIKTFLERVYLGRMSSELKTRVLRNANRADLILTVEVRRVQDRDLLFGSKLARRVSGERVVF